MSSQVTQWYPGHWKGKNGGKKSFGGGWYRFYGKLSVCQTGPQIGRAVLQLPLALELLHYGPVLQGMQIPERRPPVHRVVLLGAVQEQGTADAVPHHSKGPTGALPARCIPNRSVPACLTPRLSGHQHLCPYRGYRQQGQREEACSTVREDARA